MADIFATVIVATAQVQAARDAAAQFQGGAGMLTTGLSASGAEPATHYISSGLIPAEIVQALTMCDVSSLHPDEAIGNAGLRMCQT